MIEDIPAKDHLNFSCQSCGNCCREFQININESDISRIIENKPELREEDFIDFLQNEENCELGFSRNNYWGKNLPVLKKINGACIFLDKNNLCSIHSFKPLACRTWPFKLSEKGEPVWNSSFYTFMEEKCAFIMKSHSSEEKKLLRKQVVATEREKIFQDTEYKKNNITKNKFIEKKYFQDLAEIIKRNYIFETNKILEFCNIEVGISQFLTDNLNFQKVNFLRESKLDLVEIQNFSTIFFTNTLERTIKPKLFLEKLYSKINSSQRIIFTVKNSLNLIMLREILYYGSFSSNNLLMDRDINYFSLSVLKELFEKSGFISENFYSQPKKYNSGFLGIKNIVEKVLSSKLNLDTFQQEHDIYAFTFILKKTD
jgi:Fe-S-cluster containining protein